MKPRRPFITTFALAAGLIMITACTRKDKPPEPPPAPTPAAAVDVPPTPEPSPIPNPSPVPSPVPPAPSPSPIPEPTPPADGAQGQPQGATKSPDPVQWLEDRQARAEDYKRRLRDAESTLADAGPVVQRWERNLLGFKNPFYTPPKLTPDEQQAIQGMDGIARVKWAQDRLDEAKAAQDAAQKTVNDLKANPPPL